MEHISEQLRKTADQDTARALFTEMGLKYSDINTASIYRLRAFIDIEFTAQDTICNMHCGKIDEVVNGKDEIVYAQIKCNGVHFTSREAITFNRDGFIGFAGWADSGNVRPVIEAFLRWLDEKVHGPAES